jgi:hypothetical protein
LVGEVSDDDCLLLGGTGQNDFDEPLCAVWVTSIHFQPSFQKEQFRLSRQFSINRAAILPAFRQNVASSAASCQCVHGFYPNAFCMGTCMKGTVGSADSYHLPKIWTFRRVATNCEIFLHQNLLSAF